MLTEKSDVTLCLIALFTQRRCNVRSRFKQQILIVALIYGLFAGPFMAWFGILSLIATFSPQASLLQVLAFPVIGFITLIANWCAISVLPKVMPRFWFAIAFLLHIYFGVAGINTDDVYAVLLGVVSLLYSYWEFSVFLRLVPTPVVAPSEPPNDPS